MPQEAMDWSKPEVLVALFAALVSSAALITSMVSIAINRRHNKAVLRPRLAFDYRIEPLSEIATVTVTNRGQGPADVTRFSIRVDGSPPNELGLNRIEEVTQALGLPEGTVWSFLQAEKDTIAPDQSIHLIAAPIAEYSQSQAKKLRDAFRRVEYVIAYVSSDGGEHQEERSSGKTAFPVLSP